ncbi:fluoride efflux transporter CrcB [Parabacteroides sp. OttesenSCG-928-G21]|nr:fluoride efflux transporter CrcB [Parabacteroides sp. OttesenSCG-928-G21]
MIKQILLVGLGGGVGSIFRYLTSVWVLRRFTYDFPLATFIVNIVGCFLIGLLIGFSFKHNWVDENIKLLLITGFCGGYTTFSAFALENWGMIETGNYGAFVFNVLGSVVLGITAVFMGLLLTR